MPVTVFGLNFAYNISLAAIVMIVPLYLRHLGVAAGVLGLAASLPPAVQLLLRLPAGVLCDRIGERRVLMASGLTMAAAAAILLLVSDRGTAGLIVAALLISGVSRTIHWPAAQSYTARQAGPDLQRALGLFTSVGHLGAILGTPLAGALLARRGFPASFTLIGAAALAGLVLAYRLGQPARGRGRGQGRTSSSGTAIGLGAGLREMLGSRPLFLAGLCMAGSAMPLALLSSFYPVYLADLGMRPDAIGVLTASRAVAAAVSSLAAGLIGSRMSGRRGWLAGTVLCGLGIGATPFLSSFAGLALAIGLVGISGGMLQVLSMSITAQASHDGNRAQAMAYTGLYFSVTLFSVPMLMGLAAETAGLAAGFAGLGLLWAVLGVGLAGTVERIVPPAPAAHQPGPALSRPAARGLR